MSAEVNPEGFGFTPIGKIKAKRLRWLIEEFIPRGTLVFLSAPAKAGKSLLALYMALCLTGGKLFLGRFKTRRARVLYYCLEDHLGEVKGRAKHFLAPLGLKKFPRHLFISDAPAINLPGDRLRIETDIQTSKADVVIIDTLRRSHELDEDSSTALSPVIQAVRMWVRKYQITVLIVHHAGHKIKDKENPGDWLRGSSDLNAAWEVLIGLERLRDHVKMRVFHKYRSWAKYTYETIRGESLDKHTGDHPIIDLRLNASSHQVKADTVSVLTVLRDGSLSGNELEQKLKGKVSRPRIDDALKWLVEASQIHQSGQGRNTRWGLVSSIDADGRKDLMVDG